MNLNIFNTIKGTVLNVLSTYKEKINLLDEKPKCQVLILMEQYDDDELLTTKVNPS